MHSMTGGSRLLSMIWTDEIFFPVVRFKSVRTVIALAVLQNGLKLHKVDVPISILISELEKVVYMKQPERFVTKGQEHLLCKQN